MTIDQIATGVKRRDIKAKPILIGIDGYGGAGKTTLAQALATALGDAHVVAIDIFIVKEKLAEPSWDGGAFDRVRFEQQVLRLARHGQPIAYQRLDWEMNTLSAAIIVPAPTYSIVEGISAYHPSSEEYYDFKIWSETPIVLAQQRGHARDGSNDNAGYWDLWAQNDLAYQRRYHPERRADYVFKNP